MSGKNANAYLRFGHESKEAMIEARKYRDRKNKNIKRWKKEYGLTVTDEQHDKFLENKTIIKKIIPILDFVKTLN